MAIAPPFELLDLADGQALAVTVRSVESGEISFTPSGTSSPKTVPMLRLSVDTQDKPAGPPYVDVTSRTLQAQLAPMLNVPGFLPRRLTFTARGSGLKKRYEVGSAPVQEGSRV